MSLPYVVDGETELDSELFNPWVDHMNGLQNGALPIALAGIEGALDSIAVKNVGVGVANILDHNGGWGVADNIPAINAALGYVSDTYGGGEVVLPSHRIYPIKPSTTNYIQIPSNCRLNLGDARLQVASDSPAYNTIMTGLGGLSSAVSNISVIGGEIDQNPTGHVLSNAVTYKQYAVASYNVDGFDVDGTTFLTNGVNTVVANGLACRNVRVRNSDFTFTSDSVTPYDNSAVYFNATGMEVLDNRFYTGIDYLARGAFELHGPLALAQGNRSWNYETLANLVSASSTYLAASQPHMSRVSDNIGYGLKHGITVWALASYRNIVIDNNQLYIQQLTRDDIVFSGINWILTESATAPAQGVRVTNNHIEFEAGDSRTTNAGGTALSYASCAGIRTASQNKLSDSVISDNTIINAPLRGISLGANLFAGSEHENVVVERNVQVNSGYNRAWHRDQRSPFFLAGKFTNTRIRDNVLVVTNADGTSTDQRYIYQDAGVTSGGGNEFVHNDVMVNGGHTLVEHDISATFALRRTAAATTLGTVVGKKEVFNEHGVSQGFLPVYDAIT